jgi:hypothetical protein
MMITDPLMDRYTVPSYWHKRIRATVTLSERDAANLIGLGLPAHNPLVAGSSPARPTSEEPCPGAASKLKGNTKKKLLPVRPWRAVIRTLSTPPIRVGTAPARPPLPVPRT